MNSALSRLRLLALTTALCLAALLPDRATSAEAADYGITSKFLGNGRSLRDALGV